MVSSNSIDWKNKEKDMMWSFSRFYFNLWKTFKEDINNIQNIQQIVTSIRSNENDQLMVLSEKALPLSAKTECTSQV